MKQFYKYFGIGAMMLFSFYYTEKIALFMRSNDPIYETIQDVSETSNVDYVNAEIQDTTIIPGINGLAINTEKSFQKMKSFGAFNKYYLIFDQVKPEISLEDHKDKVIKEGNEKKKSVAFIFTEQNELSGYFKKNGILASLLIKKEDYEKENYFEQINNDSKNWKDVENLLESMKQNKNICIINNYNKELCQKENKYLIKPNLELTSTNVAMVKGKLKSGSIILVNSTAKLEDMKLLLKEINYKGLKVVTLSNLILEENNSEIINDK